MRITQDSARQEAMHTALSQTKLSWPRNNKQEQGLGGTGSTCWSWVLAMKQYQPNNHGPRFSDLCAHQWNIPYTKAETIQLIMLVENNTADNEENVIWVLWWDS